MLVDTYFFLLSVFDSNQIGELNEQVEGQSGAIEKQAESVAGGL
jgi:hypothetical protein